MYNALVTNNLIYGLFHPITGELRYIGQSTRGLKQTKVYTRPYFANKKRYVASWIKSLNKQGLIPEIYIIEDNIKNKETLNELEIFYISYFKMIGCNLTNLAEGGHGNSGYKMSDEAKIKISEATKKNKNLQLARKKYFDNNPHPKWYNNPNSETYKDHLRSMAIDANKKAIEKLSIKVKDQYGTIYKSMAEAARILKLSHSEVCNNIQEKNKSVKGFKFQRVT